MMRGYRTRMVFWLAFTLSPALARACTIPVFRYALERWESDRFQVIVYHDGPLASDQAAALDKLDQQSVVRGGPLNIEIIRYDVSSPDPPKLLVAERPSAEQQLPHIEIRARTGATRDAGVQWSREWQGSFAAAITDSRLFDSPARQEIVRRILDGHSAVWLLIAPDTEKGRRDGGTLQKSLDAVAQKIPPPQGIGLPGSELHASVPLEIRFSVLTLSHKEAAESRFLELLSARTTNWKNDETYVIPIFGRCRALDVIPYAELNDATTEEIAGFICGACSCQVKQANPGFDLLVSANWEEKLFGIPEAAISEDAATASTNSSPSRPRTETDASAEPELVAIPSGTAASSGSLEQGEMARSTFTRVATAPPTSIEQSTQVQFAHYTRLPWSFLVIGSLIVAIVIVVGVGVGVSIAAKR